MVLLKYLRKKGTVLPNPDGPLSKFMPSVAIFSAEAKDLVNTMRFQEITAIPVLYRQGKSLERQKGC